MCCKRYHIIFSTFSLKFKCKICVQKEVIHNFKNHILVSWPATKLLICKYLFFGRSIWSPHRAYVIENLNTWQAVLKSLNAPGFRGVAQGTVCWSIETLNRVDRLITSTLFLCYYQTATNFFHSVQKARNFIWPYFWVLKSRWCQCLGGYEQILAETN